MFLKSQVSDATPSSADLLASIFSSRCLTFYILPYHRRMEEFSPLMSFANLKIDS